MARRPAYQLRGATTGSVTIEVDEKSVHDVHMMLDKWINSEKTDAKAKAANREGAKVLARALRAEVGKSSSRMRKAVYYHNMRGSKTAVIVGHHKRKSHGPGAYGSPADKGDFWPMVIGGTVDHGPRFYKKEGRYRHGYLTWKNKDGEWVTKARVQGVRPGTDAVRKVAEGPNGASAMDKMIEVFTKE